MGQSESSLFQCEDKVNAQSEPIRGNNDHANPREKKVIYLTMSNDTDDDDDDDDVSSREYFKKDERRVMRETSPKAGKSSDGKNDKDEYLVENFNTTMNLKSTSPHGLVPLDRVLTLADSSDADSIKSTLDDVYVLDEGRQGEIERLRGSPFEAVQHDAGILAENTDGQDLEDAILGHSQTEPNDSTATNDGENLSSDEHVATDQVTLALDVDAAQEDMKNETILAGEEISEETNNFENIPGDATNEPTIAAIDGETNQMIGDRSTSVYNTDDTTVMLEGELVQEDTDSRSLHEVISEDTNRVHIANDSENHSSGGTAPAVDELNVVIDDKPIQEVLQIILGWSQVNADEIDTIQANGKSEDSNTANIATQSFDQQPVDDKSTTMTIVKSEEAIDAVDSLDEIYHIPSPPSSPMKLQLPVTPSRFLDSKKSSVGNPKSPSSNASVGSSIKSGSSAGAHPSRWIASSGLVCMKAYDPNLFSSMKGCSRCFSMASEKDQKAFLLRGSSVTIQVTKGGCASACPYVDCQNVFSEGVPLCRTCFSNLHNNPQMEKRKLHEKTRLRSVSREKKPTNTI